MMGLGNLIKRNIKLFFKDKGMFFSSSLRCSPLAA